MKFPRSACSERQRNGAGPQLGDSWLAPLFGRKGACSFLTQTQLCPVVWAITVGLLFMFFFKVRPSRWAWSPRLAALTLEPARLVFVSA